MHRLGYILAFSVAIFAVVASVITSKAVVVRNNWTAKSVAYKKKYANDLRPQVSDLEATVDRLKNELLRSQELWGKFWDGVQTNVANPADGSINVNIGTESGIHQDLLLHGFEMAADKSSIYRGSFLATEVGNGSSVLKPNWRVTADDVNQWQPGLWRWRNSVPSGFQENFDRQLLTLLRVEETLADRRRTLAGQSTLLDQANDALKLREAELLGGELLSKAESVDPEFRDGLVAAVEQTEEQRNQALRQIDELRRKVRAVQAEIERLNAENAALVEKLPTPQPAKEVTQSN